MNFFVLLIFAVLPSLIWLWFFLIRDPNPEPRSMIIKVFLLGALMVVPAAAIQYLFVLTWPPLIIALIFASFVEEVAKYGAARWGAFRSPEFDEPVDAMIYMITAGLGFAALENLLYLISPEIDTLPLLAGSSLMRFLTATFLHALASGLWGYFIALQVFYRKRGFAWLGLVVATAIHAVYNLAVIGLSGQMDNQPYLAYTLLLMIPLGVGIMDVIAFARLKQPIQQNEQKEALTQTR